MKKVTYILGAAMLMLLPSCRFIKVSDDRLKDFDDKIEVFQGSSEKITASDNYITREDPTGEFHAITSNLPGEMIYVPGECGIKIYGPDNIVEKVTIDNQNGRLEIKSGVQRIRNLKDGFTITVSSPVLEGITINGAGTFKAKEGITALNFKATLNGAGDLIISGLQANEAEVIVNGAADADIDDLDCDLLKIDIFGAGDAKLSGKAGRANMSITGAGDIDARKLECADLNTSVRGLGSVKKPKS